MYHSQADLLHYRVRATQFIGFTAPLLQAAELAPLFSLYAKRIFIQHEDFKRFMEAFLATADASGICRHTGVIVGTFDPEQSHWTLVRQYEWTNVQVKPWGHVLPATCPKCLCALPYEKLGFKRLTDGTIQWKCRHPKCNHFQSFSLNRGDGWELSGSGPWITRKFQLPDRQ